MIPSDEMTRSTPSMLFAIDSGSVACATQRRVALGAPCGFRASAMTFQPRSTYSATKYLPRYPVAPAIKTVLVLLLLLIFVGVDVLCFFEELFSFEARMRARRDAFDESFDVESRLEQWRTKDRGIRSYVHDYLISTPNLVCILGIVDTSYNTY